MRWFALLLGMVAALPATRTQATDFGREVEPLLRRHCHRCHGAAKQEGGLRLDQATVALRGGESGALLQRGAAEESLLWQRISSAEHGDQMPPDAAPLSAGEQQRIRHWIDQGAPWPETDAAPHWAYIAPVRPALPAVQNPAWCATPVDHFLLQSMEAAGVTPQPPADPSKLLRRVYLSLIGLPPPVEVIKAFSQDPSDAHYRLIVDQLLESPRFGEHWARPWLDLARYADSNGFQADQLRDSWPYRDWVIRALNAGLPFDQFVIQQIAGDMLPDATLDNKIATGFHRTVVCNVEAGVHPEENRTNQLFDRVNTTGTVFLGATLECAQCHDHKYDPWTMRDYYQLMAYFNNTPMEVELTSGVTYDFVGPKLELPYSEDQRQTLDQLQADLQTVDQKLKARVAATQTAFDKWLQRLRLQTSVDQPTWQLLHPARFTSTGGETMTVLDDQSVLVQGQIPDATVYELEFRDLAPAALGLRLETLRHPSLPGGGPGRGDPKRTNFVLHEIECFWKQSDGSLQPIRLTQATADFAQEKFDPAGAIDGKSNTGWAIANQFEQDHWIEVRFAEPLQPPDNATLLVRLDQHFGNGRTIGCLRCQARLREEATVELEPELVEALRNEKLNRKQRAELRTRFDQQDAETQTLLERQASLKKQLAAVQPASTLVMVEMPQPRETFIMQRGNYLSPGDQVQPAIPSLFTSAHSNLPPNRLGLAQWLVSRDNPLLARVTVNRWWAQLWGQGLVATLEDFGSQCEPPTHPELLDYLAVEFMDSGWSMRHVLRQIVCSAAFRQSASAPVQQWERDPTNQLYARGPRFRLPAETIRDNALAISGMLSTKMHGPPVMPYQPQGVWNSIGRNQPKWIAAEDEDRFRRGIYVVWKRAAPYPSFVTFDAPERVTCTVARSRSNTPMQALALLNDQAYAELAAALVQQVLRETSDDDAQRLDQLFLRALSRKPTSSESSIMLGLLRQQREHLQANPTDARRRQQLLPPPLRTAEHDAIQQGAWFAIANALLCLDETISL